MTQLRTIALGILIRFLGFGLALGTLSGGLYGFIAFPVYALLKNGDFNSYFILGMGFGMIFGAMGGMILGLALGILSGILFSVFTLLYLPHLATPPNNTFVKFGALIGSIGAILGIIYINIAPSTLGLLYIFALPFLVDSSSIPDDSFPLLLVSLAWIVTIFSLAFSGAKIAQWAIQTQAHSPT